jgi:hypothetical protein
VHAVHPHAYMFAFMQSGLRIVRTADCAVYCSNRVPISRLVENFGLQRSAARIPRLVQITAQDRTGEDSPAETGTGRWSYLK